MIRGRIQSADSPRVGAKLGNRGNCHDTLKTAVEQRKRRLPLVQRHPPGRTYNAGAGGSNPSPPTHFVMFMIAHATAQGSSAMRHAKVLVEA
jgi:hypothetical protein